MKSSSRTAGKLWWVIAAVSATAILGVCWWLATLFQSPLQAEANAAPPSPAPIYAVAREGTLAKKLTFTGEVKPATETQISFIAPSGVALSVITGRPLDTGAVVSVGQVLTEVNGRPVLLGQSPFPFYRDLGYGDVGPDVRALQSTLAAAGYPIEVDGRLEAQTTRAIARWFEANGYVAPTRERDQVENADTQNAPTAKSGGKEEGSDTTPVAAAPTPVTKDAYLPVTEVVAMNASSASTLKGLPVGARVAAAGSADLILGADDSTITVTTSASSVTEVAEGDPASIEYAGTVLDGVVTSITLPQPQSVSDAAPPANGTAPEGGQSADATLMITPSTAFTRNPQLSQARITITKEVTTETAILVPTLAITDRGSGGAVVLKRREDGTDVEVPVQVLGSLDGEVAVQAVNPGGIITGDELRVG